MKKFAFLALLFFIFFIAGMYESPALMVLFLTQIFLMAVMGVLAVYLKNHLLVSFGEELVWAEKDCPFTWSLRAENSGRLPISRFCMSFRVYEKKKAGKKRKVYGDCPDPESTLFFEDTAVHCGIYIFRSENLRVYDYLALFSGKKKTENEMRVIVFPKKYQAQAEPAPAFSGREEAYQKTSTLSGNDYSEIRQVREYRDGDSVRCIHWNQTARTGQMWVKEYEEETKGQVSLYLEPKDQSSGDASGDGFYTLLYGIVSGLLEQVSAVQVYWAGKGDTKILKKEVRDDRQCRELFFFLYQTEDGLPEEKKSKRNTDYGGLEGAMRLTRDLSWYAGDRLIYRFSEEKLEEELTHKSFRIWTGDRL